MKLTMKQKEFAKELVLGEDKGNATEAVMQSYNVKNRNTASGIGAENMAKPHIRAEVDRLLEEHDLTDDLVAKRLKEGVDATHVVMTKTAGGTQVKETKVPDRDVRLKYIQEVNKIKGSYAPDRIQTENVNIDVTLESMSTDEINKLLKELLYENTKGSTKKLPRGTNTASTKTDNDS